MLPVPMEDYCEPCGVTAFEGSVVLSGPDGMAGSFTPDAAEQTGLRLIEAAMQARVWANPALGPK